MHLSKWTAFRSLNGLPWSLGVAVVCALALAACGEGSSGEDSVELDCASPELVGYDVAKLRAGNTSCETAAVVTAKASECLLPERGKDCRELKVGEGSWACAAQVIGPPGSGGLSEVVCLGSGGSVEFEVQLNGEFEIARGTALGDPAPERTSLDGPIQDCSVFGQGSDASIDFIGPRARSICNEWIRDAANGMTLWLQGESQAEGNTAVVCQVVFSKRVLAIVSDSDNSAVRGSDACSTLIASGWEDPGPGGFNPYGE